MIKVVHPCEPLVLTKNKSKWLADYLAAKKTYQANKSKPNKHNLTQVENKYRHSDIKRDLKIMFSGKCAYCESHIAHVDYGHIEHFRPKSKYPRLCFEWKNLLLGCAICNGSTYKGTNFPTAKLNGPIVNPTTENPDDFLDFIYDPITGVSSVLGKNKRGDTTWKLLGLNRIELLKHRNSIVRKLSFVAIQASKGDIDALNELKNCLNKDEEYSAFAKKLFKKEMLNPDCG